MTHFPQNDQQKCSFPKWPAKVGAWPPAPLPFAHATGDMAGGVILENLPLCFGFVPSHQM